jgi:hypothetical protein
VRPKTWAQAITMAKSDAVRLDRERLVERISRMRFNPAEGNEDEQTYRRTWNAAVGAILRDVFGVAP